MKWFFKWDSTKSVEWNTYEFNEMLDMHRQQCRKWEERHGGYICVVERVRDKYLLPRIREFLDILSNVASEGQPGKETSHVA
jgi:hypothetical protein